MRDQVDRLRRLAADLREAAAAEEHALNLVPASRRRPATRAAAAVAAAPPALPGQGRRLDSTLATPDLLRSAATASASSRCWRNLLDNALRHTPPGGHVDVDTDGTGGRGASITRHRRRRGHPADQLDAVFDRFHRIDPSRVTTDGSGSGLGLTIARAIVTDHGGMLTAHSAGVGHGSTFALELPIIPEHIGTGSSPRAGRSRRSAAHDGSQPHNV